VPETEASAVPETAVSAVPETAVARPVGTMARMASTTPAPLTVGFDLDMTLIDSRPGIRACYQALAERTGTFVDADLAVTRLGPPLAEELRNWFPEDEVPAMADLYRSMYPTYAIATTPALPGAREAIAAVQAAGGRAIVVTAKYEPNARLHLEHLGIEPDALVGDLWAEAKARALRAYAAGVYVGDHLGDIRAARAADALSVTVATGPFGADELRAAGTDVALADLTAFPRWLAGYLEETDGAPGAPEAARA
jgi:phosphoglycolate phosphatase